MDRRRALRTQMERDSRDLAHGTTCVPSWFTVKYYRDHGLQNPVVLEDIVRWKALTERLELPEKPNQWMSELVRVNWSLLT